MATKGYVKLRRGLLEHMNIMNSSELKVYITLLLLANFKNGSVNITLANLADSCGLSYKIINLSVKRLVAMKYINYKPAVNQNRDSKFKILKYACVNTTEPTTEPTTEARPVDLPKEAPKKLEELKEVKRSKDLKTEPRFACPLPNKQFEKDHALTVKATLNLNGIGQKTLNAYLNCAFVGCLTIRRRWQYEGCEEKDFDTCKKFISHNLQSLKDSLDRKMVRGWPPAYLEGIVVKEINEFGEEWFKNERR